MNAILYNTTFTSITSTWVTETRHNYVSEHKSVENFTWIIGYFPSRTFTLTQTYTLTL